MPQPEVASLYGGPATRRVRTRDLMLAKQRGEKWAMLTSYDQYTAAIFDQAGDSARQRFALPNAKYQQWRCLRQRFAIGDCDLHVCFFPARMCKAQR